MEFEHCLLYAPAIVCVFVQEQREHVQLKSFLLKSISQPTLFFVSLIRIFSSSSLHFLFLPFYCCILCGVALVVPMSMCAVLPFVRLEHHFFFNSTISAHSSVNWNNDSVCGRNDIVARRLADGKSFRLTANEHRTHAAQQRSLFGENEIK